MNDEELTKLAVAQLIAEGEKFKRRHELRYTFEEPSRLKPNLRYFKNTLKNCVSSNDRKDRIRKSKAADELKYLENRANELKACDKTDKNTNEKTREEDRSEKHRYERTPSYSSEKKSSTHIQKRSLKKMKKT